MVEYSLLTAISLSILLVIMFMYFLVRIQETVGEKRFTKQVLAFLHEYFPYLTVKVEEEGGLESDPHVIARTRKSNYRLQLIEIRKRSLRRSKLLPKLELRCRMQIKRQEDKTPEFTVIMRPESVSTALFGGEDVLVGDDYVDARVRFKSSQPSEFLRYFRGGKGKEFLREVARITCFKEIKVQLTAKKIVLHFVGHRVGTSHVKEVMGLGLLLMTHDYLLKLAAASMKDAHLSSLDIGSEEEPIFEEPLAISSDHPSLGNVEAILLDLLRAKFSDVTVSSPRTVVVRPYLGPFTEIRFMIEARSREIKVLAKGQKILDEDLTLRLVNDCVSEETATARKKDHSINQCLHVEGSPAKLVELISEERSLLRMVMELPLPSQSPFVRMQYDNTSHVITVEFVVLLMNDEIKTIQRVLQLLEELSWFLELKIAW